MLDKPRAIEVCLLFAVTLLFGSPFVTRFGPGFVPIEWQIGALFLAVWAYILWPRR